jgi:transcriptional regulator GlxA family with amidase domain
VQIAFALYDRFTALDIIGPFNVLAYVPGVEARFVAETLEPVTADVGRPVIVPDLTFADCDRPDIVVVPGGPGSTRIAEITALTDWLRRVHPTTTYTTSVCTGAYALAGAGLLEGLRATTHWSALDGLSAYGAEPVAERVVDEGRIITGAGVSAGIDMALTLVGRHWGDRTAQAIQLGIEYDPQPPYDAGSPAKAPPEVVAFLRDGAMFG